MPPRKGLPGPGAPHPSLWGMCRPQTSPQQGRVTQSPDHNNAPFCPGGDRGHCVRWPWPVAGGSARLSERQDCLGQPPGLGLPPHTSQQTQSRRRDSHSTNSDSHSRGQSSAETIGSETPRPRGSQGRDRKQELWGNLNNSELRVHFPGPGGRASENLQPGRQSER